MHMGMIVPTSRLKKHDVSYKYGVGAGNVRYWTNWQWSTADSSQGSVHFSNDIYNNNNLLLLLNLVIHDTLLDTLSNLPRGHDQLPWL